jgi:Icc-related predicted phosphoesterase
MKITCISDLHGHYPRLEGGDLLIVAGDLTARDTVHQYIYFNEWLFTLNYTKIVVIAGNHDNFLQSDERNDYDILQGMGLPIEYLQDSGTEFEGLKIWGSPWTLAFEGMNPHCKAFTVETDEELAEKWALIPKDTDILITHSPPKGAMDTNTWGEHCGSSALSYICCEELDKLKLHVFGHIHEGYGKAPMSDGSFVLVNASHVNERYRPINKPIKIELYE